MAETTTNALVGCAELPPGMSRANYFQKLDLLEVAGIYSGAPSRKAVRGWRDKSPESARFSVIAQSELSHAKGFGLSDSARETTEKLADYCSILDAETVLFKTPATYAPSASNREAVRRYFNEIATAELFGSTRRVWEADGLWEPGTVMSMAQELGVLVAVDPLALDPFGDKNESLMIHMSQPEVYMRIMGMGSSRRRFESYQLEMLAEMLLDIERAWVLFGNPGKLPDAQALRKMLAAYDAE